MKMTQEWERGDKAALDATTGQVALIGLMTDGEPYGGMRNAESESFLLGVFWDKIGELDLATDRIIGFNILGFDLPFLIRRSAILGVKWNKHLENDLLSYNPKCVIDLMRYWQFGDRRHYVSLKVLCGAFGIPVKEGPVNGKNFHEYWNGDHVQRQLAIHYNEADVGATRELAKRMGIMP